MDVNKVLFWIGHASFYIKNDGYTIFIDPFNIGPSINEKADLVLVTHAHMDHCNKDEIAKVLKPEGLVISAPNCLGGNEFKNFQVAKPGFSDRFKTSSIEAVPAYNTKKERLMFHPKENNWVGYIIGIGGLKIYHAGDTDFTDEMKGLNGIWTSLLPMGGTYVMDAAEASEAANAIGAEHSVPMHYKQVLGKEKADAAEQEFKKKVKNALFMKEVQEPRYSF